ncbi:MAG: hypothetical protein KJ734_03695, partial [Chloroflexi bacterium]|nr:hypothetical protein [Chloroflexota bacterium]
LSPEVEPEIERLLRAGQRIAAIKLYREHTDVSLKQAKDAVDAIGTSIGLPAPSHGAMSSWSCVIWAGALVAGFLLWMVVLVLAIEGVGYGVRLLFGDTWSAAWGEMVQVCTGFFLVFASIAGFIMWGNARISQR